MSRVAAFALGYAVALIIDWLILEYRPGWAGLQPIPRVSDEPDVTFAGGGW